MARTFLEAWFAIWYDDSGQRRSPDDAEQRYHAWQADAEASTLAPLRRQQQHLDTVHFPSAECLPAEPKVGTRQQRSVVGGNVAGAPSATASTRTFGSGSSGRSTPTSRCVRI